MNAGAFLGGVLKGQGHFDLYNQESNKSPKLPRTQQQHTGGGIRDLISQTAGQIQTPGPAAPPQVAQPPGPVIRFRIQPISGASSPASCNSRAKVQETVLHQVQPEHAGCIRYLTDATLLSIP